MCFITALAHEIEVPFQHDILFENDHFLVVDKPHFLTISPTGQYVQQTLLVRLKKQTGIEHLTPIHRLDRETAGLVMFSKMYSQSRAVSANVCRSTGSKNLIMRLHRLTANLKFHAYCKTTYAKKVNRSTLCKS